MKKFLTVLLVIAVMFTFSFGSAFAFEAGTAPDTISDGYFENLWTEYVKTSHDYEGFTISKAVLSGMKEEAKAVYDAHMETVTDYVTTDAAFAGIFETSITAKAKAFRLAAAAAQFAADKDAALSKLATVATYNYSSEKITDTVKAYVEGVTSKSAEGKTYQEAAEMLVAAYVAAIEAEDDFNADVAVADYKTASGNVKDVVADNFYAVAYVVDTEVYLTGAYDLAYVYTAPTGTKDGVAYVSQAAVNKWSSEVIDADNQKDAANVAAVKASNAAKYANYIVGADAAAVAKAAKWLKIADILAEEGKTAAEIGEVEAKLNEYVTKADAIAELEEYAAKWGAEKNADGELVRDPAVVKVELEKGIVAIATAAAGDIDDALEAAKTEISNAVSAVVADKLAFVKKSAIKSIEDAVAAAEYDYFAAEYAKVQALAEKYIAKIEAAEKIDDVNDAVTNYNADVTAIDTADDVRTSCTTGALSATVGDLVDFARAYVTYYNTGKDTDDQLDANQLEDRIVEMVGESGLRTKAEIKKLTAEATTVAQGLPTVGAVKAAKKAVKAAVDAIPATITVGALAQVQAAVDAQDAYEELTDVPSDQETAISTAVTKLISAYNTSFVKDVATISKTDEAAVNALLEKIYEAIDTLDALGATDTPYLDALAVKLEGYLTEIQKAEKKAVEEAIKAIPVNVTDADKATVEKARELYDAYVAKYNDYDKYTTGAPLAGYAADDIEIGALTAAEVVLGLNAPDPEENAKAYVQDLSIKARSVKTSKGVKVTINADVQPLLDDGFTVEYRFYRSTKSNANFGSPMIVKTTNTYTNTKGVKGTRYYYKAKLVVKNAAGEVVATTPLTQCLYATRVF